MSAYIVDDNHIRLLIDVAIRGPIEKEDDLRFSWYHMPPEAERVVRDEATLGNASRIFFLLLHENIKSICYRDESEKIEDYQNRLLGETYRMLKQRPTAIKALKAIDCYEYQSYEHPGWKTSEAKTFCEALRKHVIRYLPGYEQAPWEWTQS